MTDFIARSTPKTGLAIPARLGVLASMLLLISAFAWMQMTMISGAIIASGEVVVRGKPKEVQSLNGGVVQDIFVKDGDFVRFGDPLLRLDPTILQINLDIYRARLAEVLAREMRLQSEYQGLEEPDFSGDISYLNLEDMKLHFTGQREIFHARQEVLEGRKDQLSERILQFQNQIAGVEGQIISKQNQLEFVIQELENVRGLNREGLARESEVLDLQRAESVLLGDIAESQTKLAQIRNSIRDTELEILQTDREFKEEVVTDLREVTASRAELVLQIVNAEKELERIDIVAPADGIIHELQVSTVGGVVAPQATIVQVIPLSEGVEFEFRVDPQSIDQVFIGQRSKVIFPGFNSRSAPEVFGTVSGISATSVTDEATGQSFFRIELTLPPEELNRLGDAKLIPGMPVEAFLQTGERSVLSYLTKPMTDQLRRAFRES